MEHRSEVSYHPPWGFRYVLYCAFGNVDVPTDVGVEEAKRRAKEVWEDTSGGCHRTLLVYPDVIDIQPAVPYSFA